MTRVDEFDAFYSDSRRELLHQAYALTGDMAAATAAVEDAYARAWQHWPKVRTRDPLGYVRPEAWRLALLRHGTHLLRRRHHDAPDTDLLDALSELSTTSRRLVILQTLAGLDLAAAAREVGVTADSALETTDRAASATARRLGGTVAEVEARLDGLRRTTDATTLPRASRVRRAGRQRQRRNTVLAAIGSVAAVLGAGVFVTAPAPAGGSDEVAALRLQPDAATTAPRPPPRGSSGDLLLPATETTRLDPGRRWRALSTASDVSRTQAYAPCQARRFADRRLRAAWVRTFVASGPGRQRLVQAVEVSRTPSHAVAGMRRMVQWYAGCEEPRTQLLGAYAIHRDGPDDVVLTLRRWSQPVSTVTVGLSRSGVVTTALVHSVDQPHGPRPARFGDLMNESASMVCASSSGRCDILGEVRPRELPRTGEGAGFLGVVDLPPVARLATTWAGTEPVRANPNPSATLCDDADFTGGGVSRARSRVYVMPEARALPEEFGISETVGQFRSRAQAAAFMRQVAAQVRACPDRNVTADVGKAAQLRTGPLTATAWRISYEISSKRSLDYWLGFVRDGDRVAQIAFSSVGGFDISAVQFRALIDRAGQRLRELG